MWKKILALVVLFTLTVPFYRSHIFSLNFVDEEDNIVIGHYLQNGHKLYSDIYSQHQPAQFVMSNWLNQITTPDNILLTVKRHREFVLIWSLLWIILLTFRFGYPLFLIASVLELTKILLLGNLFLAESLIIYPLIYLLSLFFPRLAIKSKQELLCSLFILIYLGLSLTPIWPLLAVLYLYLFISYSDKKSLIIYSVLSLSITLLVLIPQVDFLDYYHDAFFINSNYYIPLTTGISLNDTVLKSLLSPLYTLFAPHTSPLVPLLKILSLGFVLSVLYLLYRKQYFLSTLVILILALSSLRYIDPASTLYAGFHMLPWYVTLTTLTILYFPPHRIVRSIFFFSLIICAFLVARQNLFDSRNPATDYYVNYSPSEDLNNAIKIISGQKEYSLWVEPVNYWLHYQSGTKLYTSMINYYSWMDQTPPLKNELSLALSRQLPDLLYLNNQNLALGDKLDLYTPIIRDGKATELYLRSDLIPSVTESDRAALSFYRFSF